MYQDFNVGVFCCFLYVFMTYFLACAHYYTLFTSLSSIFLNYFLIFHNKKSGIILLINQTFFWCKISIFNVNYPQTLVLSVFFGIVTKLITNIYRIIYNFPAHK